MRRGLVKNRNWWDLLSDELVQLVFIRLDLASLGKISRVCKRFLVASRDQFIWKSLYQTRWGSLNVSAARSLNTDPTNDWKDLYKKRLIGVLKNQVERHLYGTGRPAKHPKGKKKYHDPDSPFDFRMVNSMVKRMRLTFILEVEATSWDDIRSIEVPRRYCTSLPSSSLVRIFSEEFFIPKIKLLQVRKIRVLASSWATHQMRVTIMEISYPNQEGSKWKFVTKSPGMWLGSIRSIDDLSVTLGEPNIRCSDCIVGLWPPNKSKNQGLMSSSVSFLWLTFDNRHLLHCFFPRQSLSQDVKKKTELIMELNPNQLGFDDHSVYFSVRTAGVSRFEHVFHRLFPREFKSEDQWQEDLHRMVTIVVIEDSHHSFKNKPVIPWHAGAFSGHFNPLNLEDADNEEGDDSHSFILVDLLLIHHDTKAQLFSFSGVCEMVRVNHPCGDSFGLPSDAIYYSFSSGNIGTSGRSFRGGMYYSPETQRCVISSLEILLDLNAIWSVGN